MAKSDYLARILKERDVDVLALQETHLTGTSAPSRSRIEGYTLLSRIDHEQYGIAWYMKKT